MNNEKKCCKYESIFVFQGEDALNAHIKDCPECAEEHDKYLQVSKLVKEIAPVYLKKQQRRKINALRAAACFFIVFTGLTVFYTGFYGYENTAYQEMQIEDSYIGSLGLPTDDFGFLEL